MINGLVVRSGAWTKAPSGVRQQRAEPHKGQRHGSGRDHGKGAMSMKGGAGSEVEHPGHHGEYAQDLLDPEEAREQEPDAAGDEPQGCWHGKAARMPVAATITPSGGPTNPVAVSPTESSRPLAREN
ncbi:hypothetical protein [Paeniglutamicibacter cryotolerans]|uniref:Uncharacterized protein n=1 Tax=Paeniglutamicibacter cryotolerans TaxID=670079 RepID=A0A839QP91_9MICC|nr:hypothetical protein [Paeniglutamicibacter cryotolerans]MBB2996594.1 hypothetical protein [Paeniglutamicibacter cryotolerans]